MNREHSILEPRILIPFVAVSLIWGSTWLVITSQLGPVPPTWSVAYRFAIAAAAMFVYIRLIGASPRLNRHGHFVALLLGLLQFGLNFNAVYLAEGYVTSGLVAVIFALVVVPNSILAWLVLGHRITPRFALGSIVAICGVGLLFSGELHGGIAGSSLLLGISLGVASTLSVSIANVVQAMERVRVHTLPALTGWGMAYGSLANIVISALAYGPPVFDPRPTYWLGMVYLGIVASAVAFSLYLPLVRAIGPGKAAYTSLIVPLIAMLLSSLFEDYVWTAGAAIGAMLTLTGLFIALRSKRAS